MKTARILLPLLAVALFWVGGQALADPQPPAAPTTPSPTSTSSSPAARAGHTTSAELTELLDQVDVVDARPDRPGYERDCGPGHGCSFGTAWTDDYDGPGGHDGCDTRNNVLRASVSRPAAREGTRGCVIVSGTLRDPYTGAQVEFAKARASKVQIDHLYPLAAAWDLGADRWSQAKRIRFANDVDRNLLAVDGSANASKGDRTPGEWMPINRSFACTYVTRYLQVAIAYDLPVTRSDVASIRAAGTTCPKTSDHGEKVRP